MIRGILVAVLAVSACTSDDKAATPGAAASSDAGAANADSAADADSAAPGDGGADVAIDPTSNADPQDLDPVNGDPALDIASSQIFFEDGAPWVRVTFFGAWPPSSQLYSWGCAVLLGTENAPVVTYTRQADTGKESDLVDGIDAAKIAYAQEPTGFRVRFADTTIAFDRYAIQCNLQKTKDSPPVDDASGAFVVTTRNPRPFGG